MPEGEPGGPDTEMFWDFGEGLKLHESSMWSDKPCHVNCDCGRFMEIGNNVFMEYVKQTDVFGKLAKQNVDFGGGLERLLAAALDEPDIYKTDVLRTIISGLESISDKAYGSSAEATRAFRIIADHVRAATFIIGDPRGVPPSNVGQGYVVRRLIRRAVREGRRLGITDPFLSRTAAVIIGMYGGHYADLETNQQRIMDELSKEEEKFAKTIEKGLKEFERMMADHVVSGEEAFILFSTYGFPLELTQELVGERGGNLDVAAFKSEFERHQELSRTASAGAFKGGLADHSVETTRLHTATHLLHEALRQVLGEHVAQKGSNITVERLRFDFSHFQKMTPEEIAKVEELVNEAIRKDFTVSRTEMTVDEAKTQGAIGLFEQKYGDKVSVYTVGDFSKEICGGPHVVQTGELGLFKILKEEAVSAGVRRIKATVSGK
jgi:alanyl-tRNA synthetase